MITKSEFPRLYRGADTYSLNVFGPYVNGEYDVEIFVNDDLEPRSTVTIARNTHVIGDVYDSVTEAIADWHANA